MDEKRLLDLLERGVVALEALVLHAFNVDLRATPPTPEELARQEREAARLDTSQVDVGEKIAALEWLESEEGIVLPAEIWEDLGVEPPRPGLPQPNIEQEKERERDEEEALRSRALSPLPEADEDTDDPLTVFHRVRYDPDHIDTSHD